MSLFDPGRTRVKICGITNEADARIAIDAGADGLGFNFFPGSKRWIDPAAAIPWIRELGAGATRVAVVVNPEPALLEVIRSANCFEAVQFHGDEPPALCEAAGFPCWIKATRVRDASDVTHAIAYGTPHLLLDSWVANSYGGTGHRLDWDLVRDESQQLGGRQLILAGGLTPHNVRQAIRIVRPHAVDVAGGVELSPGRKDEYLVREFVKAAHASPAA